MRVAHAGSEQRSTVAAVTPSGRTHERVGVWLVTCEVESGASWRGGAGGLEVLELELLSLVELLTVVETELLLVVEAELLAAEPVELEEELNVEEVAVLDALDSCELLSRDDELLWRELLLPWDDELASCELLLSREDGPLLSPVDELLSWEEVLPWDELLSWEEALSPVVRLMAIVVRVVDIVPVDAGPEPVLDSGKGADAVPHATVNVAPAESSASLATSIPISQPRQYAVPNMAPMEPPSTGLTVRNDVAATPPSATPGYTSTAFEVPATATSS